MSRRVKIDHEKVIMCLSKVSKVFTTAKLTYLECQTVLMMCDKLVTQIEEEKIFKQKKVKRADSSKGG